MARGNDTTGTSLLSDAGRVVASRLAGGRCPVCRGQMILWGAARETRLTIDHVHPHKLGGGVEGNLVPLCGSCNFSKSDTPLVEWLPIRLAAIRNAAFVHARTVAAVEARVIALRDDLTTALVEEGIWTAEAVEEAA